MAPRRPRQWWRTAKRGKFDKLKRHADNLDAHHAEITVVDMQLSHFSAHLPAPGEPLRILEEWICSNCGSGHWIEIVIEDGRIRSMDLVPFDRATLDRVNFVADGLAEFFQESTGESLYVDDESALTGLRGSGLIWRNDGPRDKVLA